MSTQVMTRPETRADRHPVKPRRRRRRSNIPAGLAAGVWFLIVAIPIYFIVVTSIRTQDAYVADGPLDPPTSVTFDNYTNVLELGFATFLRNSVIAALATVVLVLALALPAAYAIVRGRSRAVRMGFTLFLIGLAIPAQAVIIPIYLIITRLHLYDSLTAIVLPTAAFSLPMAVVVLTSALRDVPNELYEAMTVDGAGPGTLFRRLVVPLSRPALASVGIFAGLNAWNGFLFPLVLTQSSDQRVLPLGLWNFQSQYGTDVPGLLAAVVLSALPVLALYLFGRRHLLSGLAAGFSK
ncbi:carbohydrate ABC transporter permease [Cryptosporangium aurantiacum]|uniref:Carbohydrate ABC transporter membrane protein 2, CUT1 family n=1 Tax=Cryptosporangium aurantiacum TaxID=134849 RepID=A0A1M7HNY3_9ACTN|nr:carbohydrate ABC transporter permease [Cryptosporangium aurantiacum]SHM30194.1 carbohydrate ABC transporter membrane protein 2, CUT1 family [Cryptosporangium aurantiacum]